MVCAGVQRMRVLITGMAGFIGYHCAAALSKMGHQVAGIDNLNDYYSPSLKKARLAQLDEEVSFILTDLADFDSVRDVFASFEPEVVLNLAAQAGVRYSLKNPHAYIQSNVVGMMHILECCRHFGKPRLVYASSSSVYGGNTRLPFSEKDRVDHPISIYAATKKANELMAHSYTHLYDIQTIGLRFFTVYGPWGRPDMAMWLFADAINQGKPINVFNYGDMNRDFTYIDDVIEGVLGALFGTDLEKYEIFNLGNHRSERLGTLIELIEEGLGRRAEKNMLPMQDGDVQSTFADIDAAHEKLGFQPTTELSDGVARFLAWFRAHPEFHG